MGNLERFLLLTLGSLMSHLGGLVRPCERHHQPTRQLQVCRAGAEMGFSALSRGGTACPSLESRGLACVPVDTRYLHAGLPQHKSGAPLTWDTCGHAGDTHTQAC